MQTGREIDATLSRSLGRTQLLAMGVGAIIGAGIFVAVGVVAATSSGPAVALSLVLAAIACLSAALCYAEMATMVPEAGGAYSFARMAFGTATGWLIGWCLTLEYLMAAATVAVGWSGYANDLLATFGIHLPAALVTPTFAVGVVGGPTSAQFNLPAILVTAAVVAVLVRGVRVSAAVTSLLVAIKVTAILTFVVVGAFAINPDNWVPFVPPSTGTFGEFGWSGVARGAATVFYAFLGFDALATAAREARDAQRDIPIAIIGALAVCTGLYVLFALVLTGIAPYHLLGTANPVGTALDYAGPHMAPLKVVVAVGALVGLTSVLMVAFYAQSRITYAMSRDGLLPARLGRLNMNTRAPTLAILLSGAVVILAAGLFPIAVLGELISIGTLTAFSFVSAGVLVLRYRRPDAPRGFRVPYAPFTCIAGVVICGYLLAVLPGAAWIRFSLWVILGFVYYGWRRLRTHPPHDLSSSLDGAV